MSAAVTLAVSVAHRLPWTWPPPMPRAPLL